MLTTNPVNTAIQISNRTGFTKRHFLRVTASHWSTTTEDSAIIRLQQITSPLPTGQYQIKWSISLTFHKAAAL